MLFPDDRKPRKNTYILEDSVSKKPECLLLARDVQNACAVTKEGTVLKQVTETKSCDLC